MMKQLEIIQELLKESSCNDGHVSSSFEFVTKRIETSFEFDIKAYYDNDAKSWYPNSKNVIYFELKEIKDWKKELGIELKEFFYLSEYDSNPELHKEQIRLLQKSQDMKIENLISLLEVLTHQKKYVVFEVDVRLDGYYACYSKDYVYKLEDIFYILRASIDD